jgi:hypothetical protein
MCQDTGASMVSKMHGVCYGTHISSFPLIVTGGGSRRPRSLASQTKNWMKMHGLQSNSRVLLRVRE